MYINIYILLFLCPRLATLNHIGGITTHQLEYLLTALLRERREKASRATTINVMARQKAKSRKIAVKIAIRLPKEAGGGAPSRWRVWGAGGVVGCRGDGPHYGVSRCQDLSEISRTEVNVSASSARDCLVGARCRETYG